MRYLSLCALCAVTALAFACSDSTPTTPSTPPAFDTTSSPTDTLSVLGNSREASSCGQADMLAMRFSNPGFIAGTHVGMYLNLEGLPEGEKTLRIWWDYDNNPDKHQDISLASDTDIEFNPPIEHVYQGANIGDQFKVRILVMASASTADCSRVREITLEGGAEPAAPAGTGLPTGPLTSCNAWLAAGATSDGTYSIDPDGAGPVAPFSAFCDMTTNGGGWTVVGHDREATYPVDGFEGPGSSGHNAAVTYEIPVSAVNALMAGATEARQSLVKDCVHSIISSGYTFWTTLAGVDVNGRWPGGSSQCDINDFVWRMDGGDITDPTILPIGSVTTGDTGSPWEGARITIGRLRIR